jgi:hypothetical protein
MNPEIVRVFTLVIPTLLVKIAVKLASPSSRTATAQGFGAVTDSMILPPGWVLGGLQALPVAVKFTGARRRSGR